LTYHYYNKKARVVPGFFYLMGISFLGLMISEESIKHSGNNILLFLRQLLNVGYFFD